MALELWQIALLVVVGTASGFLNVMAGGGSLLSVPVMVFMGLPGPVANGTNRVAILAQNLTAISTFARRGFQDFRLSVSLAACTIPGAIIGAFAGTQLEGVWFNRLLALVMIAVMVVMHFDRKKPTATVAIHDPSPQPAPKPSVRQRSLGHLFMVAVGFWGGFIQIGVGFIIMPILSRVMGLDLVLTNMHKVFIIACYTLVALLVFASQIELFWLAGITLALGNAFGGYLGAHFTVTRGEGLIKTVFNVVLVLFIIKLLFAS